MHPVLFGTVRAYPVWLALSVVGGVLTSLVLARRSGIRMVSFLGLQVGVAIAAVVGAKLYGGSYSTFAWGYRYPGGLAAALLALPLLTRFWRIDASVAVVADVVAPGIGVAMAAIRLGCWMAGCCYGLVSDVPWAATFPRFSLAWDDHLSQGLIEPASPQSLPVHPLQVYLGVWALLSAFAALAWRRRQQGVGEVMLVFLIVHETGRFVLEGLRAPAQSMPGLRVASLAVLIAAAGLLTAMRVRQARRGFVPTG